MMKTRYKNIESITVMGRASKQVLGPVIDLLLWNVYKCRREGWKQDFIQLAKDKDLVLLQEAIFNSPFDPLFSHSQQHQWVMARSFKNLKTNIDNGVKTGSTVEALHHTFSASAYSEPITNTKKMLLVTEYPLCSKQASTHQTLLVINVHAINFVSFKKFSEHLEQAFSVIGHHQGPVILAGDFNTWNNRRWQYFNSRANTYSLKEASIHRQPRMNHFFKHLDHIYYRDLTVQHVFVDDTIKSSDHYPISLSLLLN